MIEWAIEAFFKPVSIAMKSLEIYSGDIVSDMHFDIIKDLRFPRFFYDCKITRMTKTGEFTELLFFEYLYEVDTNIFEVRASIHSPSKFKKILEKYNGDGSFHELLDEVYFIGKAGPFIKALDELRPFLHLMITGSSGVLEDRFEFVKDAK